MATKGFEIRIDDIERLPLHVRIEYSVMRAIGNRDLTEGDILPAPADLSSRLGVEITDADRAYADLEHMGLLKNVNGNWTVSIARGRPEESKPCDLWEKLRAISRSIPESEWAKLPRDASVNLDKYLYGRTDEPVE